MAYSALILCMVYRANKRECAPIAEHIVTGTVQLKWQQGSQRVYNITFRHIRIIIVAVEKQNVLHILSVCVYVVLVTQHVKRMRSIVLSSVACLALRCVSILSHKRHDFRERKVIEHEMWSDFLNKFRLRYFSF